MRKSAIMIGFMAKKHTPLLRRLSAQTLRTIALGTICSIGAFAVGIETAGDVHPFAQSQAAIQELVYDGDPLAGDVNANGNLDAEDAYIILQVAQGLLTPTPNHIRRGDTDGDFQLTTKDLNRVLHLLSTR